MKKQYYLRVISTIIGLIISFSLYSQKEANNWLCSNFGLEFHNDSVILQQDYAVEDGMGVGIISDHNGNLLFYTDGFTVWNANHDQMPDGNELIPKGGSYVRETIIIPKPGSESIFYIFTVDPKSYHDSSGLYYSIVDMSLDNGLGNVTEKGVRILNDTSNKITAVLHKNNKDVWLITHKYKTNSYYSYLITATGISEPPVISSVGHVVTSSFDGQLKASPDGRMIACSYFEWNDDSTDFDLFSFNSFTGELYNPMSFKLPVSEYSGDGLEFSSDASKLFVIQWGGGLYQYNLKNNTYVEIENSRILLNNPKYSSYEEMQLAPNGKIYITKGGGSDGEAYLGVIENPNEYGEKCIVLENGFYLGEEATSVTRLSHFIQNYFFSPNFVFDNNCQGTDINFEITNDYNLDSVRWNFGGGSSTNDLSPVVKYQSSGEFIIQMIAYYREYSDTITKNITINPFPVFKLNSDSAVCRGAELSVPEKFKSYSWSNGDSTRSTKVQEEALYKVTVTNSFGCSSSDSIFLSVIDLPQINMPDTIVLGELDSVRLDPGNFDNYLWSTGDTNSFIYANEEAWYSVEVTNDQSCSSSQSVYVSENKEIVEKNDWELLNPKPSFLTGRDIAFVNDQIGFIINGEELLKTNDCGETWKIVMKIDNANRIAFNNGIGYIVGDKGQIYKSTHLGGGWNKLSNDFTDNLNSISMVSPDTIMITSDNKLFYTNDGGNTWEIKVIDNVDIEDSYFTGAMIGHIACRNGKILKTIDRGESWYVTESISSFPSDFFTIYFVNDSIGFATREYDEILKTTDGGESWEELSGYFNACYDFYFIDDLTGYAVGEYGVMFKTTDGGENWENSGYLNGRYGSSSMYGVSFINEKVGFAVGMRGVIVKTIDGGENWTTYAPTYTDVKQLDFVTSKIGYALIGNDFYKTTNGGYEWKNIGRPIFNEKTYRFSFTDEDTGFVITGGDVDSSGASNKVYKTTNGGITWSPTNNDFGYYSDGFYSIDFINENLGFISGSYNLKYVFKTKNGGETWQKVESICFSKIQFLDSLTGYAVQLYSAYPKVYKTYDGGTTWNAVLEVDKNIKSFHFIDKDNGYIVGDDRLMYKTTDGGITWQEVVIPYEYYDDVCFYSQNIGYIFDEEGNLYQTQNGGASWSKLLKQYGLKNIEIENENVFISGSNGVIMKGEIDYDSVYINTYPVEKLSNTSAMLSANVASNDANVTDIYFEYGRNFTFDHVVEVTPDFVTAYSAENVYAAISGLNANSTYQYRLRVDYQDTIIVSSVKEFTTLPDYEITLNYPYCHFSDQINLNGEILSRGKPISEVEFQYKKDSIFVGVSAVPDSVPGDTMLNVEANITGLLPETEYLVRLKAEFANDTIFSTTHSFVTLSPYVISLYNPYINGDKVTLAGSISSYKDTIRNLGFEYGTSREYSNYIECTKSSVNPGESSQVQVELLDLDTDSIYFYRIRGKIDTSIIYSNENILSFNEEIIMIPIGVEELSDSSLRVDAYIKTNGEYVRNIQFRFGASGEFNDSVLTDPSYAIGYQIVSVSAIINRLTPDTEYCFKVRGTYNNEDIYSDQFLYTINKQSDSKKWILTSDIEIYPNPTNGIITIRSSAKINRIELINIEGKLLKTVQNTNTMNIANYQSGVYIIKAFIGNRSIIKKVVRR